eukprot:PhM_4_TR6910/c0_g1_i1/m.28211/K19995/SCAMP; secretory carrier-associated membrane protein
MKEMSPRSTSPATSPQTGASREKDLEAREAELSRRERDLRLLEERQRPNFPPKFLCIQPVVRHDIDQTIPPARAGFMRMLFGFYYIASLVLVFNLACTIAAAASPSKDNSSSSFMTQFGVSVVHLLGIPGAFILWYYPTYTALGTGKSYFVCQVGLTVAFFYHLFMALGIMGYGAAGWLFAFTVKDEKEGGVAFGMALVCAFLFTSATGYLAWVFVRVRKYSLEDKATSIAATLGQAASVL